MLGQVTVVSGGVLVALIVVLTALSIIRDPFYTKIKIDQRVSGVQFFGNVGGFLGLLTGLSVISLVEIFYHLGLLCTRLCKRR